jgi:hypothetical protein
MSDRCLFSFYETSDGQTVDWRDRVVGNAKPSGEDFTYDDALKFTSALKDFTGMFGTVYSGKENAIDCNNKVSNTTLDVSRMVANGGKYPITIKGGCSCVTITGQLSGHGKECDVDAGNRSEQSDEWVEFLTLGLRPEILGDKIKVRCLMAHEPYFMEGTGPYEYAFPSPLKWYHGLVVGLLQLWWKIRY